MHDPLWMRAFLAVHLPKLPLEVFRPKWSAEPAHGCAVLEKDEVVIADNAARAAGVCLGMKRGGMANTCWTLLTVSSAPRLNSTTGSGCRRPSSTLPQPQRG